LRTEKISAPGFKVLDVGCGKGDFLRALDFLPAQKKFALDLNEPAIRACRAQGFNAFCGTVETAIAASFLPPGGFPVVTAFHCLEHVSEPVGFVSELLRATAPGGKLFLSTPYSPMSFERDWFDVLNHPPHHMTRWNLAAYRRLAEILGVQMRHFAPRNRPLKQALQVFRLKTYGANVKVPRATLLKDLLRHAPQFVSDWGKLRARARQHEIGGSDLILVEFTVA
jgi:SAM-dependent methyltransferase